jgi:hypothetical protein
MFQKLLLLEIAMQDTIVLAQLTHQSNLQHQLVLIHWKEPGKQLIVQLVHIIHLWHNLVVCLAQLVIIVILSVCLCLKIAHMDTSVALALKI